MSMQQQIMCHARCIQLRVQLGQWHKIGWHLKGILRALFNVKSTWCSWPINCWAWSSYRIKLRKPLWTITIRSMYTIIKNELIIKTFPSWNQALDWMQARADAADLKLILVAWPTIDTKQFRLPTLFRKWATHLLDPKQSGHPSLDLATGLVLLKLRFTETSRIITF